jgi:hypothetical protein
MEEAVAIQSSLPYMEPEHFYLPLRQCLAALYLAKAADFDKQDGGSESLRYLQMAINTYLIDLKIHPHNGWSLKGIATALAKQRIENLTHSAAANTTVPSLRGILRESSSIEQFGAITLTLHLQSDETQDSEMSYFDDYGKHWKAGISISGSCCELGYC